MLSKQITTISQAIDQFVYRLSNGRFEPKKKDVDSLNFIIEWVNNAQVNKLKENELFSKLFTHVFLQEIQFFNGDAKLAQKKMMEYLSLPLDFYENEFCKKYEFIFMQDFLKQNKAEQFGEVNFEDLSPDKQTEFESIFMKLDNSEKIKKSLKKTIVESIFKYGK